jgi:hypothetical protein
MAVRHMAHSGQGTLKSTGADGNVGQGASSAWPVVVTVIVEELAEVGFGLKVAVVSAGNPVALKVRLSVKPPVRAIVMV